MIQEPRLAAVELAYYAGSQQRLHDRASLLGWLALLIGLIAMVADLLWMGSVFLDLGGMGAYYRTRPYYFFRMLAWSVPSFVQHGLMMLAGAMMVLRLRFAWHMTLAYLFAGIASATILIGFVIFDTLTPSGRTIAAFHSVHQCSSGMAAILFYLMV